MRSIVVALCTLSLFGVSAGAWNSVGHRAIAEIAWRQLDPAERQAATELLQKHPHYKQLLAVNVPPGVDTNHWAFLNAALWPDQIRPAKAGQPKRPELFTKYNIYSHAILLPVVRTSEVANVSIENFKIDPANAVNGLSNSLARLNDSGLRAKDRAVSLTWVLHLMGDLHQPLHAATLVTKKKPKGNGAGGAFVVRDPMGRLVEMHGFWDGLPGRDGSIEGIGTLADEVSKSPELAPGKLAEYRDNKTVFSWAREGWEIADHFGYAEGQIDFVLGSAVKSGKIKTADVPKMTPEYATRAERIARRRMALAGQRLADALKTAL